LRTRHSNPGTEPLFCLTLSRFEHESHRKTRFFNKLLDPRHATRHNIGRILLYEYDKLKNHLGHLPSKRDVDMYSILSANFYSRVFGSWTAFEKIVRD
jgi:hypothetical protein